MFPDMFPDTLPDTLPDTFPDILPIILPDMLPTTLPVKLPANESAVNIPTLMLAAVMSPVNAILPPTILPETARPSNNPTCLILG